MPDRYYFFFARSIYATRVSSAFRKPRWTVHDIRANIPDIFDAGHTYTCTQARQCLATPLLQQFLWTVDVGQEFVIPRPSHSCSFSWRDTGSRISTIFLAKDNCRENGIPSCKKSRVMSYIISSRATCTNARSLSPLLRRNARFRRMPSRTRTGKEIVLLAPTQPTRCLLLAFFISSYGTFISLEISHLRANMPINTIRFVSEMGIKLMIHTWTFVSFKLNSSSITNCPLSTLTNFISEGKQIVCSNNTFSSEVKVTSGVA